jgi:hypothetical protein
VTALRSRGRLWARRTDVSTLVAARLGPMLCGPGPGAWVLKSRVPAFEVLRVARDDSAVTLNIGVSTTKFDTRRWHPFAGMGSVRAHEFVARCAGARQAGGRELLASRHIANLIPEREDRLIVLLQGGEELDALMRKYLTEAETSFAGLGRPFSLHEGAVDSVRDAELVVRPLGARARASEAAAFRGSRSHRVGHRGHACQSLEPIVGASFERSSSATGGSTKRWSSTLGSTSTSAELQRPFTCTRTRCGTGWAGSRSFSNARCTSCRPSPACTSRRRSTGSRADPQAARPARSPRRRPEHRGFPKSERCVRVSHGCWPLEAYARNRVV